MRLATILLGSAVLLGCGSSTRVIDTDWQSSDHVDKMLAEVSAEGSQVLLVGRDTRRPLFDLMLSGDTAFVDLAERILNDERWEATRVVLTVPRSHIHEVRVRNENKHYVTGIRRGVAMGFLVGGLVAEFDAGCKTRGLECLDEFLLGVGVGTLLGGIAGALLAPNSKTLYRFRPHTPQQMSVVIGVGPSMTQQGRSR